MATKPVPTKPLPMPEFPTPAHLQPETKPIFDAFHTAQTERPANERRIAALARGLSIDYGHAADAELRGGRADIGPAVDHSDEIERLRHRNRVLSEIERRFQARKNEAMKIVNQREAERCRPWYAELQRRKAAAIAALIEIEAEDAEFWRRARAAHYTRLAEYLPPGTFWPAAEGRHSHAAAWFEAAARHYGVTPPQG